VQGLSASLLALYREAETRPALEYAEWALDELRQRLPFDAALWTSGYLSQGDLHVHESLQAGPDRVLLRNLPAARQADPLLMRAQKTPGTAVSASQQSTHVLAVCCVDPHTFLASTIALYRAAGKAPFRVGECEYLEAIAAHLVETRGIALIRELMRAAGSASAPLTSSGVADGLAQLQVAPPDFQRLLRLEWPGWSDRALPPPLERLVRARAGWRYVGKRIVVAVSAMGDVFLLQPREKRPVDSLSPRECEVARLMADGHTYKQAAQQLGVAPSTVRNHLRAIFAVLGVNNQANMASALRDLD
jgi:DNA-binding CsgD family transcriptional regulator